MELLIFGYEITAKRLPYEEVKWDSDWKAGFWVGVVSGTAPWLIVAVGLAMFGVHFAS